MKIKFSILSEIFSTLFTEEESNKELSSSANNATDNIDAQNTESIPLKTDLAGHSSAHDIILLALY